MNYKKLEEGIKKYLKENGNYIPDIDDYNVELFLTGLKLSEQALNLLENNTGNNTGVIVTIPNGNGIETTKANPALGAYKECIILAREAAIKLGINRNDRIKLKIEEQLDNDPYKILMKKHKQ